MGEAASEQMEWSIAGDNENMCDCSDVDTHVKSIAGQEYGPS